MRVIDTDVLVIGTGGAGLYAAIRASEAGQRVTILDKGLVGRSGGTVSGAGVSAVGPWSESEDSVDVHFRDTVIGGSYLSDQPLVRVLTSEAQDRVREMESWGLCFDKKPDGRYVLDRAGGHAYSRVMAISDRVGLQMTKVLRAQLLRQGVEHHPDVTTTRLFTKDGKIVGAMGLDLSHGDLVQFNAPAVVLATGGVGQLYPVTSNPIKVTGDGLALALEAGASLINMEQVQFYPCGLVHPPSLHGFILGIQEYAKLYNIHEERFMAKYEPELIEHVTRDRLARGIYTEIAEGRGTEHGGVFLDATEVPEETLQSFMYEREMCAERGFDYHEKRVEIAPSAHFFMGGVAINSDAETTVPGLYAAGEVSGGVQGGNRLSGNSLSEILVFGSRAGVSAARYAAQSDRKTPDKATVDDEAARIQQLLQRDDSDLRPAQAKERLHTVMQAHVYVSRSIKGLETAREALQEISQELLPRITISGPGLHQNYSLLGYLDMEKMVQVADMIVAAAQTRTESRGAHYMEDYPEQDTTSPPYCTVINKGDSSSDLNVGKRPVEITELQPETP